jgi:hypothetical protein
MPAFNLVQDLSRVVRKAADLLSVLWLYAPQLERASASSNRSSHSRQQPFIQHMRSTGPIQLDGPQTYDIVDELYTCMQATIKLEDRLVECGKMICSVQRIEDVASVELARLGPILRAKYPEFAAASERRHAEALAAKPALLAERLSLKEDLNQQQQRAMQGWLQMCKHAPAYFNQCLEAGFREAWSLGEQNCLALRPVLDILDLNQRAKSKLRKLSYKQVNVRSTQWKAEKGIRDASSSVLPDTLGRRLDLIRAKRFADDMDAVKAEMHLLQAEIADRDEVLRLLMRNVLFDFIGQDVEVIRQMKAKEMESTERINDHSVSDQDEATRSTPDSKSMSQDTEHAELYEVFEDARLYLEEMQEEIALYRSHMLNEMNQARHMLTFSDSSPASFAARQASKRQEHDEILRKAEGAFEIARSDLLASGAQITPSSPRDLKRPLGGGRGRDARSSKSKARGSAASANSFKIRHLDRRRLNEWRTRPQSVVSESGVTKRSSANLSGLGSGRSRSPAASPESYRQRKLKEYVAEQTRIRQEATNGQRSRESTTKS